MISCSNATAAAGNLNIVIDWQWQLHCNWEWVRMELGIGIGMGTGTRTGTGTGTAMKINRYHSINWNSSVERLPNLVQKTPNTHMRHTLAHLFNVSTHFHVAPMFVLLYVRLCVCVF